MPVPMLIAPSEQAPSLTLEHAAITEEETDIGYKPTLIGEGTVPGFTKVGIDYHVSLDSYCLPQAGQPPVNMMPFFHHLAALVCI